MALGSSPNGLGLLRPGDGLIAIVSAALIAVLFMHTMVPSGRLIVRQDGQIFTETDVRLDRTLRVPGPLGETVIEIRAGRVRVASDPSPRQLCVRQGWLHSGESAVCLPNRVSLEWGQLGYDSLGY